LERETDIIIANTTDYTSIFLKHIWTRNFTKNTWTRDWWI